ncbi:MAG: site-2 protease family protein [Thermoplasmata archaeon]|nr:MAG: site-2 protease family protein [Thermoplasmata archaeon]
MDVEINVPDNAEVTRTLQELRFIVSKYFSVEGVRWSEQSAVFYILPDELRLEENFDELRKELIQKGYVPVLEQEQNDFLIYITKRPPVEPRSVKVNIVMFALTLLCTIWAGAILWAPRVDVELKSLAEIFAVLGNAELLGYGALFFALPLMLILGIHEFGHYFMSKKHGVDASLPFFIPIPPFIGPLGTFGAFISMREPMPSKKALMDIGAAGPIAGFIVAIPVTIVGLALTSAYPVSVEPDGEYLMYLGSPLIFEGLQMLLPIPADTSIHPTAFAGWVGILVTSMNLLPAGQLDGGHIMRALFGDRAKYVSYSVVFILLILGFGFAGWWIFTFLILLLGTSHPPPLNDVTKLTSDRKLMGAFSIVMLVICFVPIPILIEEYLEPDFQVEVIDDELIAGSGEIVNYTIILRNTGEDEDSYKISIEMMGWTSKIINITDNQTKEPGFIEVVDEIPVNNSENDKWYVRLEYTELTLAKNTEMNFSIQVKVPATAEVGETFSIGVNILSDSDSDLEKEFELSLRVGWLSVRYTDNTNRIHADNITRFKISVKNTGNEFMTVVLNATIERNTSRSDNLDDWPEPVLSLYELDLEPNNSSIIILEVEAPKSAAINDYINIVFRAENKINSTVFDEGIFKVTVD